MALTFLKLSGTSYEQGFQHGQRLKERIPGGALSFFQKFLGLTIRNSDAPWLEKPLLFLMEHTLSRKIARQLPQDTLDLVRGLSDGSGIAYEDLLLAYTMPDTFIAMIARFQKVMGALPVDPIQIGSGPVCGCSSVIAGRSATRDGKLYHARNFDYPAVGYWDRDPLVMLTEPRDGMPFLSIGTAGIPAGGVTGVNAAGISLVIHQHWVTDVDVEGVPVGVAGEMALRHARSLDDAIRIIREYPPVCGWTYLISDGKTGEACALEVAPGRSGVIRLGETGVKDSLGYSNVFLSPELHQKEFGLFPPYWDNCGARLRRANELLRAGFGRHTPESLASILGDDRESADSDPRLFGNVIPMVLTIATVVFDPEDSVMWVSEGAVPSCHGRFVPYSLHDGDVSRTRAPFETKGFGGDPARNEAYQLYVKSYRSYFEHRDDVEALALIRRATGLVSAAPELWHLRGLLALRVLDSRDALDAFSRAAAGFTETGRKAEARLGLAFALDLEGHRGDASAIYRELRDDPATPENLRKRARRGTLMAFSKRRARALPIDFTFGALL